MALVRRRVFVIGVGMTKFERPQTKQWDYPDMGREAGVLTMACHPCVDCSSLL